MQVIYLWARSREKKRVELNQTALLVGDIYTDLRVDLAMTGAINVRFVFFGPFYKRVARGAFSLTLTCRTILPLSFDGDFQCIHVYPSSWAWLEFVQWSSWRRSFAKMSLRTSPKQSPARGSRWQCSGLRCGRSSDSIAKETDSSPDPEEERQQHSCSSLLSISLTSELAHTTHCLGQAFFFLAPRVTMQEKGISRGLIARSTHTWGFDASNPSWVNHRRMHRCVVATPFFLFHYPLIWPTLLSGFRTRLSQAMTFKIIITNLRGSYRANDEVITCEIVDSKNQYLETS